jgi:hypothetical protein
MDSCVRGNGYVGKRFLPSSFAKATEDRAVEMTGGAGLTVEGKKISPCGRNDRGRSK